MYIQRLNQEAQLWGFPGGSAYHKRVIYYFLYYAVKISLPWH